MVEIANVLGNGGNKLFYRVLNKADLVKDKKTDFICSKCGGKLVIRQSKKSGRHFLGCEKFPDCKYMEGIRINSPNRLSGIDIELKKINEKLDRILLEIEKLSSIGEDV